MTSPDATAYDTVPPLEFVHEDDLRTFEGWIKFQAIDLAALTDEERSAVRQIFDAAVQRRETARKVGRMKLTTRPGEYRYAVVVREGDDLWLTLWVLRSPKGEFFIFQPRGDRDWIPHTSLHADGSFHLKSHDEKMLAQKRQPPASITETEHLGAYGGHGPKSVGAGCDPSDFTDVFEVPPGILGPRNGTVVVDLLAKPDATPLAHPAEEVGRRLFTDTVPHVLIRIFRS
jgi:hypothetical protein